MSIDRYSSPNAATSPTPRLLTRAGLRRLLADERGAATAELVLTTPLLLLLIMSIAQFALWMHASHIAQAAASQALSTTRVLGGTTARGQREADQILQQLGSGPLRDPRAIVSRSSDQAAVHVEGTVIQVVPFLTLTASGDAAGPVERFRAGVRP
ncbi:pilus assembly protein TadE [Amycolatopsis rubida]|uniref:Pilus assembly protein TadE n=1 Tax=Amycolatopsis rubida TaxID=112413 RepID=A0ABX0C535_9PSEU|nr:MULTISPECIES: TadE/TadG family type IV pilus assembly protein [Amycolatopsis]MYW90489.1 pilus assembly protein TadE [Amycolatopsis rubida]MYW95143.1 pilus assembly protein TadE [Amycolatopsis rubida]NEC55468.1 pilus assembly protein TadE [Amycolatopsis rubida]NEC60131.1 pilus assembly protein TadE [Amycolatopsis rubida]